MPGCRVICTLPHKRALVLRIIRANIQHLHQIASNPSQKMHFSLFYITISKSDHFGHIQSPHHQSQLSRPTTPIPFPAFSLTFYRSNGSKLDPPVTYAQRSGIFSTLSIFAELALQSSLVTLHILFLLLLELVQQFANVFDVVTIRLWLSSLGCHFLLRFIL
jgi:hypothetical protein